MIYRHMSFAALSTIIAVALAIQAQPVPDNLSLPTSHTGTAVSYSYPWGNYPTSLYVFDARHQPIEVDPPGDFPPWGYYHFDLGDADGLPDHFVYYEFAISACGYPIASAVPSDDWYVHGRNWGTQVATICVDGQFG